MPELTYPEVGATRGPLPAGYHHLRMSAVLGSGRPLFERATARLMDWQVQRGAGLRVTTDGPVRLGARSVTRLGWGPLAVCAPCEVVYVVDEPDRQGYAYGTLTGHPERGEELFLLRIDDDVVTLEVVAFSRAGTWWTRLAGPAGRVVQRRVTRRYLEALRER